MGRVMAVSFERYGRLYYLDPGHDDYSVGDRVLVPTDSGPEVAECVWAPEWVQDEGFEGLPICAGPAAAEHLERDGMNRRRRAEAKLVAKKLIKKNDLPMKVVAVDFIDSGLDFDQLVVILLHRTTSGGLPGLGGRTGPHLASANRPAADRLTRRRPAGWGPRQLWARSVLRHVPEGLRARQSADGQRTRSPAEPAEDLGCLRSADVLLEVRASAVRRVRAYRAGRGRAGCPRRWGRGSGRSPGPSRFGGDSDECQRCHAELFARCCLRRSPALRCSRRPGAGTGSAAQGPDQAAPIRWR